MLPETKSITVLDLDEMDDGNRYELVDGELYLLASPRPVHVIVNSRLHTRIQNYLGSGGCEALSAPADVFLFNQPGDSRADILTVVQPDIFVICHSKQIGERGFYGPPALAAEILSPSTRNMDRFTKYDLYQRAGVKEYWIVDPQNKTITVYTLTDGAYGAGEAFGAPQSLTSSTFPGLEIPLGEIFPEE